MSRYVQIKSDSKEVTYEIQPTIVPPVLIMTNKTWQLYKLTQPKEVQIESIKDDITGTFDTDYQLFLNTDPFTVRSLCQINHYFKNLCSVEYFWKEKLIHDYGYSIIKYILDGETYKDQYMRLLSSSLTVAIKSGRMDELIILQQQGIFFDINVEDIEYLINSNKSITHQVIIFLAEHGHLFVDKLGIIMIKEYIILTNLEFDRIFL